MCTTFLLIGTSIKTNVLLLLDLDVSLEDDDVGVVVSSLGNIGSPTVESTEESTCANRDIVITFTDLPGDQPAMTVSVSCKKRPRKTVVK